MKFIKFILGILIGIILLVLVGALFLPKSYQVQREIVISAPPSAIYEQVSNLKNWKNWSPWQHMDKAATYTFTGEMGQKGSKMQWQGDTIGLGSITIDTLMVPTKITTKLDFKEPFESQSNGYWQLKPVEGGTKVVWGNKGELDYPLGVIFGLAMDNMLGADYEKGLQNLKQTVESK